MSRGVLAAAAALESCDYDEVTEVSVHEASEGGISLLHHSSASQDIPALPFHHQLEGPPAVSPAAAPESSHSQSAIVTPTATSMTTTEVEKLEPKEDQAGEALQEPPSASDGDGGELWGEVGEGGGNMIGPQENENSDFQPGPSHAPPPPHLAPSSPHHQEHPRFHMGRSQGDDDTDEDNMGETAVRPSSPILAKPSM